MYSSVCKKMRKPAAKWAVTKRKLVENKSRQIATPALLATIRPNPCTYP